MGGDNSTSVQSRFSLTLVFPILYPRVGSGVVKNGNNWVPERFAENFDSKMQQDQNLIKKFILSFVQFFKKWFSSWNFATGSPKLKSSSYIYGFNGLGHVRDFNIFENSTVLGWKKINLSDKKLPNCIFMIKADSNHKGWTQVCFSKPIWVTFQLLK